MTTALRITATIFLALAGILYHFHQDLLSFIFTALAILVLLVSLFAHRKETKKSEKAISNPDNLIVSKLQHPDLRERSHKECVLGCSIVNKSGDTIVINKVIALDRKNEPIRITWSNRISELGNPIDPRELIGIKNAETETLFLRANSGKEIEFCKLEIYHSLSDNPLIQTFDEYEGWDS